MSSMLGFSWPHLTNTKHYKRAEPIPAPDHRGLMVGIGVAAATTGLVVFYTIFFFGLKWRKARAARKRSKDAEAQVKPIELIDNDRFRGSPSPYVGDGYQGGDLGDSCIARTSSDLPVHYSRVAKDSGKHEFVEVDIGSHRGKK